MAGVTRPPLAAVISRHEYRTNEEHTSVGSVISVHRVEKLLSRVSPGLAIDIFVWRPIHIA